MNKQEINPVNHLTDIIQTICAYYYNGRELGVRVHETGEAGISIDLYNFDGDGQPVCDGLIFNFEGSDTPMQAYCVVYNPDWEASQVRILLQEAYPSDDDYDYDTDPEELPDTVLNAIIQWLEKTMQPKQAANPFDVCSLSTLQPLLAATTAAICEMQGDKPVVEVIMHNETFVKLSCLKNMVFKAIAKKEHQKQ